MDSPSPPEPPPTQPAEPPARLPLQEAQPSQDFPQPRPILRGTVWLALLPALAALLVYLPALNFEFVWDDTIFLRDTPLYREPALWIQAVFRPFLLSPNYFRPLAVLSFIGELRLAGLNPMLFHATNLLLHAINTWLVAMLAFRWMQSARLNSTPPAGQSIASGSRSMILGRALPVIAGLLYGLHPALIEGVAFISSRFDLLMTTLLLLALLADVAVQSRWRRSLAMGAAFLGAALCKEMAVAFILALPLWHVAVQARGSSKFLSFSTLVGRNGPVYLALLAAGVAYLGIRYASLGYFIQSAAINQLPLGATGQHILLVAKSLASYVVLVVWPFTTLTPIHYSSLPIPLSEPSTWLAIVFLSLFLFGCVLVIRRAPMNFYPQAGWLALGGLAALLPVANLMPLELGGGAFIAERFLMFPLVLFSLAATMLVAGWENTPSIIRRPVFLRPASFALFWLVLSLAVVQITLPYWRDDLSLWTWAARRAPKSPTPLTNLSLESIDRGQYPLALQYARKAIALDPKNADALDDAGSALFHLQKYPEAQAAFEQAISLQPESALFWNNLAGAMREQDKLAEAEKILLDQALRLDPNLPAAHLNLGIVYLEANRPDLASQHLQTVLRLGSPELAADAQAFLDQTQEPNRWLRLGDLLIQNGLFENAAHAFDQAAVLGAPTADVAYGLSLAFIKMQDWKDATQVLNQALQSATDDARLYNNLGIVAREQGDIESARQLFSKAIELAPQWELPQQNLQALP